MSDPTEQRTIDFHTTKWEELDLCRSIRSRVAVIGNERTLISHLVSLQLEHLKEINPRPEGMTGKEAHSRIYRLAILSQTDRTVWDSIAEKWNRSLDYRYPSFRLPSFRFPCHQVIPSDRIWTFDDLLRTFAQHDDSKDDSEMVIATTLVLDSPSELPAVEVPTEWGVICSFSLDHDDDADQVMAKAMEKFRFEWLIVRDFRKMEKIHESFFCSDPLSFKWMRSPKLVASLTKLLGNDQVIVIHLTTGKVYVITDSHLFC